MFIKGKSYIVKATGVNSFPSYRFGEEKPSGLNSLVVIDESGETFTSYELHEDEAEKVISKIAHELLVTPTSENCVIDIEEVIENIANK